MIANIKDLFVFSLLLLAALLVLWSVCLVLIWLSERRLRRFYHHKWDKQAEQDRVDFRSRYPDIFGDEQINDQNKDDDNAYFD